MLQIKLGQEREAVDDELGRARVGWWPDMTEGEAWTAGRGVWKFSADRALAQDEVQIISPDDVVLAVATITGVTKHGDRFAIEGDLRRGDRRVGAPTPAPHASRNPVAYVDRPAGVRVGAAEIEPLAPVADVTVTELLRGLTTADAEDLREHGTDTPARIVVARRLARAILCFWYPTVPHTDVVVDAAMTQVIADVLGTWTILTGTYSDITDPKHQAALRMARSNGVYLGSTGR